MMSFARAVLRNSKLAQALYSDLGFLRLLRVRDLIRVLPLLRTSTSQLKQDLFALIETDFKSGGFFVEFGATDGISLSNTYLLEKQFSWSGLLVEPARHWHKELRANRPKSHIEQLCVWSKSNEILVFNEASKKELSTIQQFASDHAHGISRVSEKRYEVNTISLLDLLRKHDCPSDIDYLSIDTEGSEYEILKAFDFSEYRFSVITVEHNYTANRELIFALLTKNGYKRKNEVASGFDDWYTKI